MDCVTLTQSVVVDVPSRSPLDFSLWVSQSVVVCMYRYLCACTRTYNSFSQCIPGIIYDERYVNCMWYAAIAPRIVFYKIILTTSCVVMFASVCGVHVCVPGSRFTRYGSTHVHALFCDMWRVVDVVVLTLTLVLTLYMCVRMLMCV